jgi:hypothetical protein
MFGMSVCPCVRVSVCPSVYKQKTMKGLSNRAEILHTLRNDPETVARQVWCQSEMPFRNYAVERGSTRIFTKYNEIASNLDKTHSLIANLTFLTLHGYSLNMPDARGKMRNYAEFF